MRLLSLLRLVVSVVALVLFAGAAKCVAAGSDVLEARNRNGASPSSPALTESYGKVPLSFEPNRGQTDGRVQFLSRGPGYGIFLTPGEAVLSFQGKDKAAGQSVLQMKLVGANAAAAVEAQDKLPGTANYMKGTDRSKWATGVPTYEKVKYAGVYPGVDLVFYGNQRQLEYDFVVAPGRDAGKIALEFTGAKPVVDADGDLVLGAGGSDANGGAKFHKPVVYQMVGGKRVAVAGNYEVRGQRVGFRLGKYDHSRELVIDPVVTYLTYLGGSGNDYIDAIAVDASGAAYVTGSTSSTDFPLKNAYESSFPSNGGSGTTSIFVTKLNQSGTSLVYSTYLAATTGGSAGYGIAVDSSGSAYVAGETYGDGFPVTSGAYQTICGGQHDAQGNRVSGCSNNGNGSETGVLAKLSADGSSLVYATYLSGNNATSIRAVAVNPAGEAYVTGQTTSSCGPGPYSPSTTESFECFPTTSGSPQSATSIPETGSGFYYAFFTKFDAAGANLIYSGILGPDPAGPGGFAIGSGVAVDANGLGYITGSAGGNTFYTTGGSLQSQGAVNGNAAFVAKFDPAAQQLIYSTYLGGQNAPQDIASAIAADANGNAYVVGQTTDCDFPTTTGAFQVQSRYPPTDTANAGKCRSGFVAKLNPSGSALVWSTYLGVAPAASDDSSYAYMTAVALGSDNSVYVAGGVQGAGYPLVNPVLPQANFDNVAVITHLSADGSTALFSSTLGGTSEMTSFPPSTAANAVALDTTGAIYVAGYTDEQNLPTTNNVVQPAFAGPFGRGNGTDGFIAKISPSTPPMPNNGLTGNLLANPGAELGSLADWTAGGNGTPQVDTGTFDTGIDPHTGSYDFVGGPSSSTDSLSQTVSIIQQGITAAQVDGGTLFANVSFWEQGLNQGTPSDEGSVTLTFLDASNAAIGAPVTIGPEDSHDGTWANVTGLPAIPVGTRSITYTMNFVKNQLEDNDAFIDDNLLSIHANTGLTIFPGTLHFGNVAVGQTSDPQTVSVTNQGTTAITIAQVASELGANPADFVQTNNCPVDPAVLAAGASCTISVTFKPGGVGFKLAGVDLPDDTPPTDQFIRVDGTGTGGILQVNPGNLKTIAGTGVAGTTGNGGPATAAELNQPNGVAFDPSGNLYIADGPANVVRKVDTAGNISTFAGVGVGGFTGDGGLATQAELLDPSSVTSDALGNIYIQDTLNFVIRKVTAATGIITTIAGTPQTPGHSGDGGPATGAKFNQNQGARFDSAGNLFVPTCRGPSVRKIDTAGNISTVAGNFTQGYSGDGGLATNAQLQCPSGVAIDAAGNFYIADTSNNVIRKVTASTGIISTIAGSTAGTPGATGDGGAATAALLNLPNDVAFDGAGNLYIADSANNRVRKIDTNGIITTAAGGLNNAGSAAVNTPLGLTTDASGNVYFSDSGNSAVREIFPQGVQPFPATQVGSTSAAKMLTLSNIGNTDVTLGANGAFTTSGNAGDFALSAGSCANGTVLTANGGSCEVSITFTPTAAGQRTLTVMVADNALNTPQSFSIGGTGTNGTLITPTINWATPAPITTNTPLSAAQLDATATNASGAAVPGTYVYTPGAGALLSAGTQTLSVMFTPTDTADFASATKTVQIVVTQATSANPTTTALAVTPANSTMGQGVSFGVIVSATNGGAAFPTGTVTLTNIAVAPAVVLGTVNLATTGSGTLSLNTLAAGTYQIVGNYNGDSQFAASASPAQALTVGAAVTPPSPPFATAATIASTGAAGNYTLTGSVTGQVNLAAPSGTMTFMDITANTTLGTGTLIPTSSSFAFTTSPPYTVGFLQTGDAFFATADFNGDGKADLAFVGDFGASILLGKGDGTFTTAPNPPLEQSQGCIATGDFNGDGKADLILCDDPIQVLLGNGDGTFSVTTGPAIGSSPVSLVVGDFNADGKPDVAVIAGDNTVSVLIGSGTGSFQKSALTLAAGLQTASIAVGDFNGDGKQDLAIASYAGGFFSGTGTNFTIVLGKGDGTFNAALPSQAAGSAGTESLIIVAADVDGDGKQDLVVTDEVTGTTGFNPLDILTFIGKGDGTFATAKVSTADGHYFAAQIALKDFNGDGKADLVIADYDNISLRTSNGDGTFTLATNTPGPMTDPDHYAFAIGDFNGDGVPDIAVQDPDFDTGNIFLTQRTQTSTESLAGVAVPGSGQHMVTAAYSGDANYSASTSTPISLLATLLSQTITFGPLSNQTYPTQPITLTATASSGLPVSYSVTGPATVAGSTLTTTGVGTVTVTASQAGNATYAAAVPVAQTFTVTQAVAALTATSLTVTSGGSAAMTAASGAVVTLTATVTAGTALVSPGQVAFCDASATTCTDVHLLGTAQLTTAGVATYRFVPGIGAHSYKAVFLGTKVATGSASAAAALAVTGTYATATTIAQSGAAGNYTLTATTVGKSPLLTGPTGTVSFLDTSNANAVLSTSSLGSSTAAFALAPASGSPVAVGGGAYGVAAADLNGDGFADVVTENYNANTVSVLLGKGDGTFQPQVAYAVGGRPERVLLADLNGDGNLDLIVANTGSNTISILLGNGDGTFQAQVTYPCASPVGLGVMDIDHDGIPDVVAGDYYANTISVLIGHSDGTLSAAVTYPTGGTPQTLAEGDFDGDGNVDVVVGNESGATVGVFLGNGDGTFKTMVTYSVGSGPQGVQVGDFNGDGKLDLAVSNHDDRNVGVLLGNGDGTFQPQVTYLVGSQPVGIEVADFNGDGVLDITVGSTGNQTQDVLLGKGDGTFQAEVTFATGDFPYGVAVADFNGDGLPDVAVANFNDATTTILLSQPTETATASVTGISPPGSGTHEVVASYPGDANYAASVSEATGLVGVTIAPVITWTPTVATIAYGTALGASQLNATAATVAGVAIPGAFVYTPAAGTVLTAGAQTLSVTFTPTSSNYSVATGSAVITVTQVAPVITWAAPAGIAYGTPLSAAQLNATVTGVGTGALAGTLVYTPALGTELMPGTQTLSVVFTPTDAVDYTTATASVPIVVGGLALSGFTPAGALAGSTDTTITLTGTGFVASSEVMVNGATVATAYVNPVTLTAVIPAALLKTAGSLTVSVLDPSLETATPAQTFTVLPPTGAATLSGPTTTDPGTQPSVTLSITNPYPLALTAQFNLAFASAGTTSVDDPSIQFSSGGRTFSYAVAANSTSVPPVQLQAGTDAGTITITAKLMADGVDVTPAGLAPLVIVVPPVVPLISGTTIMRSGSTLTVVIHGFSNTREVSQAEFDFTAATGDTLATPKLTIPATTIFGTWYSDPTSVTYGSTFTYTQIFNTSADASTVGSVKVTLTNSVGASLVSTSP